MKQNIIIILTLFFCSFCIGAYSAGLKRISKEGASKEIYFTPEAPTVVQPVVTESRTTVTFPSSPSYFETSSVYEESPTYFQSSQLSTGSPVIESKSEKVYRSDEQEMANQYGLRNFDHDLEIVKEPIDAHHHQEENNYENKPEHEKTAILLNKTHSQVAEAFEKLRQVGLGIDTRPKLVDFLKKIVHFKQALEFHKTQLMNSIHKNYDILETLNLQLLKAKSSLLNLDSNDNGKLSAKLRDLDNIREQIRNIQKIKSLFSEVESSKVWDKVKYFSLNNLVYRVNHFVTVQETDPCDVFFRHISVIPIYNWVHPVYFTELNNYYAIEKRVNTIYSNFGTVLLNNVAASDDDKMDSIETKLTKDLEDVNKSFEKLGQQIQGSSQTKNEGGQTEASNKLDQTPSSEDDVNTETVEKNLEKDLNGEGAKRTHTKEVPKEDESLKKTFEDLESELAKDREEQEILEAKDLKSNKKGIDFAEDEAKKVKEIQADITENSEVESDGKQSENVKEEEAPKQQLKRAKNKPEQKLEEESVKEGAEEKVKSLEQGDAPNVSGEIDKSTNTQSLKESSEGDDNNDNSGDSGVNKETQEEEATKKSEEEAVKNSEKEVANTSEEGPAKSLEEDKEFDQLDKKLEDLKKKDEGKKAKQKKKEQVKKKDEESKDAATEDSEVEEEQKDAKKEELEEEKGDSKIFARRLKENKAGLFKSRLNSKESGKKKLFRN